MFKLWIAFQLIIIANISFTVMNQIRADTYECNTRVTITETEIISMSIVYPLIVFTGDNLDNLVKEYCDKKLLTN